MPYILVHRPIDKPFSNTSCTQTREREIERERKLFVKRAEGQHTHQKKDTLNNTENNTNTNKM